MDCHAVNTIGGLKKDLGRFVELGSRFLPVGFYYKAFYTPRRLFPFWEKQMRQMAGLGGNSISIPKRYRSPKSYSFCDVLVLGAGPAGLSAALSAAEHGARVILADEESAAGRHAWLPVGAKSGCQMLIFADLLKKVRVAGNKLIDVRVSTRSIRLLCRSLGCPG